MRVLRAALLWLALFLLAAFVIFVEFVAEVGGRAEPIPKPTDTRPPVSTPHVLHPDAGGATLIDL